MFKRFKKRKKYVQEMTWDMLCVLHDLAFAGNTGNIDCDDLIRLGERANNLIKQYGTEGSWTGLDGKRHIVWPMPPARMFRRMESARES